MQKIILIIICLQLVALAILGWLIIDTRMQAHAIPAKIDMLVDHSQDQPIINLDCPECPKCPENRDYSKEFQEIKKAIKNNNNQTGVYYYYTGCR